jgi:hypothetical protein
MIAGLTSAGGHITVSGGSPGRIYIDNNQHLAGSVKFDRGLNSLMIFDGTNWIQMPHSYASVGLNGLAESAISWAATKMVQEEEYVRLAKDHAAVQIALDNLEKAKQQLAVTVMLSKEH